MQWLTDASLEEVRGLLDRHEFFWLDLLRPTREHLTELAETVDADVEAVDRALRFGEVPQLRFYRGHAGLCSTERSQHAPARPYWSKCTFTFEVTGW